jgi:integrase
VWLTREDAEKIRAHVDDEWWPLFGLLLYTGITIGEALGLRGTDISLSERRISINEDGGRKLKRESRNRSVVFPPRHLPEMTAAVERAASGQDALLFPFSYWTARKAWLRISKNAGVDGVKLHDLRHTYAVHAVINGVPEARLQQLLGHAHYGTTRRYATHAPEQFVEQDAERVAESLGL